MRIDGVNLANGSKIINSHVESGTSFPGSPDQGRMFYLTTTSGANAPGLYVYNGSSWLTGDITSVTAGTGLSGGGTTGDITLSLSTAQTLSTLGLDDGAQGTPSLFFTNRSDVGLFTSAANTLNLALSTGFSLGITRINSPTIQSRIIIAPDPTTAVANQLWLVGGTTTDVTRPGAQVRLAGGTSTNVAGGIVQIIGGSGVSAGGGVSINGGGASGNGTNASGGGVTISGGFNNATTYGNGGHISITAGSTSGATNGSGALPGSITLRSGTNAGNNEFGSISLGTVTGTEFIITSAGNIVFSADSQINAASGQASLFLSQAGTVNGRICAAGGGGTDIQVDSLRSVRINATNDIVFSNGLTSIGGSATQNQIFAANGNAGFGVTTPTSTARIQSANGIQLGNSANANADVLDFYLEGTFTPTIAGATTAGTATYSFQNGKYTRTGNRVDFSIRLGWSSHTGTGAMSIAGLPYTSSATNFACFATWYNGLTVGSGKTLGALTANGSTSIGLWDNDPEGGAASTLAVQAAVTTLYVTGSYEV